MAGKSELNIYVNAYDKASKALKNIGKTCGDLSKSLSKLSMGMMALGGAIVAMGVMSVKTYAKMGAEVYDMALRTGFACETLSELSYMAEQTGASLAGIETGIKKMQRTLYDASRGLSTATDALAVLGLNLEDLQKLSPEEQFWALATAIANIEDPSDKAALALEIFGRAGTDLLPMLAEGAEGMEAMKQRASELGVVFDEEAAGKAKELDNALTDMEYALKGIAVAIGETLMPTLVPLLEKFVEIVKGIMDFIKANPALITAIMAIGTALLVAAVALKVFAMGLAFIHALSGPAGWAALAIGLAVAGAAYVAIGKLMEVPAVTPMAKGGFIIGEAGTEAVIPLPEGMAGIGSTYNINIGNFMGDEASLRAFARKMKDIGGEDSRRTSFSGINRLEYFPGSSAP